MVKKLFLLLTIVSLAGVSLSACSLSSKTSNLAMQPLDGMPMEVRSAPQVVQQAYQFAAANPDLMKQIPCYCGCGNIGHTSNYSCYVKNVDEAGKISYDLHALGCTLCVDITQDAMRMFQQGKTAPEIKAYVDANYAKYGPSNMP